MLPSGCACSIRSAGWRRWRAKLRPRGAPDREAPATQEPGAGRLETRLAGVVVAALKEAFDRDRTRMELERSQIESERRRAEEALAAEAPATGSGAGARPAPARRGHGHCGVDAVGRAGRRGCPGMRAGLPRALLGTGWALAFAALGCTFASWQQISAWTIRTAGATSGSDSPTSAAASAAPWTLLLALAGHRRRACWPRSDHGAPNDFGRQSVEVVSKPARSGKPSHFGNRQCNTGNRLMHHRLRRRLV